MKRSELLRSNPNLPAGHPREMGLIVKTCFQSNGCERALWLAEPRTREINPLASQIPADCHSGKLSKHARQVRGVDAREASRLEKVGRRVQVRA